MLWKTVQPSTCSVKDHQKCQQPVYKCTICSLQTFTNTLKPSHYYQCPNKYKSINSIIFKYACKIVTPAAELRVCLCAHLVVALPLLLVNCVPVFCVAWTLVKKSIGDIDHDVSTSVGHYTVKYAHYCTTQILITTQSLKCAPCVQRAKPGISRCCRCLTSSSIS